MSYSRNTTCASCVEFPRSALEAGGAAVCGGLEELRRYDFPACPLHKECHRSERDARRPLVARLREK
jgi:hypothetical protein